MYHDDYETIDQEAHKKWTNEQGEYGKHRKVYKEVCVLVCYYEINKNK